MEPSFQSVGPLLRNACTGAEKAVIVLNSLLESIYSGKFHGDCVHEQVHDFGSNKDCVLILSELRLSNKFPFLPKAFLNCALGRDFWSNVTDIFEFLDLNSRDYCQEVGRVSRTRSQAGPTVFVTPHL